MLTGISGLNGATTLQWWIPEQSPISARPSLRLQWGHHFAVVDTDGTVAGWVVWLCFNGATTLQWWIQDNWRKLDIEDNMLQWGHHFAVVDTLQHRLMHW